MVYCVQGREEKVQVNWGIFSWRMWDDWVKQHCEVVEACMLTLQFRRTCMIYLIMVCESWTIVILWGVYAHTQGL